MGNWSNGSPIGVSRRLMAALLVAFALNTTPVLVEQGRAAAQVVQERTDTPRDTLDGVHKHDDEKKDKDDKKGDGGDGGGIGPLGEGSGY